MDPSGLLLESLNFLPGYTETGIIAGRLADLSDEIPILKEIMDVAKDVGVTFVSMLFGEQGDEKEPALATPVYHRCIIEIKQTNGKIFKQKGMLIRWAKNNDDETEAGFKARLKANPDEIVAKMPGFAIPYSYEWHASPMDDTTHTEASWIWWVRFLLGMEDAATGRPPRGVFYRIPAEDTWATIKGWYNQKNVLVPFEGSTTLWNKTSDTMAMVAEYNPATWNVGTVKPRLAVTGLFCGFLDPYSEQSNYQSGGLYWPLVQMATKNAWGELQWKQFQKLGLSSDFVRFPFSRLGGGTDLVANLARVWPSIAGVTSSWEPNIPDSGKGEVQETVPVQQSDDSLFEAIVGGLAGFSIVVPTNWAPIPKMISTPMAATGKPSSAGGLLAMAALAIPFFLK